MASHFQDKNEFILVANRANMYVPFKYNSISFEYLKKETDSVKRSLNSRTYTYLVLVQLIEKQVNLPISKCAVPKSLKQETLYETQITADKFLRISKAVFQ